MTNLLLDDYKQKVKREYAQRRVVVGIVLLIVTGIIAGISILPSYVFLQKQKTIASEELDSLRSSEEGVEIENRMNELSKVNQFVDQLEPPESELRTYVLLKSVLDNINDGITVTGITVEKGQSEQEGDDSQHTVRMSLSGTADTRQALTDLKQSMESNVSFISAVNLPVSNFAERTNISFSMDLIGYF